MMCQFLLLDTSSFSSRAFTYQLDFSLFLLSLKSSVSFRYASEFLLQLLPDGYFNAVIDGYRV